MGSGFSSFVIKCATACSPDEGSVEGSSETGLGDLPESVVGSILVNLNPEDICRVAGVNKAFRGASSADFIWDLKLPENYGDIVKRVFKDDDRKDLFCKRDIYAKLCGVNSIDADSKKVWLHKDTGKPSMLISFSGLSITGIDDRRYWSRIPTEESRFSSVAYLQQIWWFQVDGEVEFPFPKGTYDLYFRIHLGRLDKRFGRWVCNRDQIHGWDAKPVSFQLSTSNGQEAKSACYLTTPGTWDLYRAGSFDVKDSKVPMKIKFSMMQIDCTHTKGGLCVDSVMICPQ